MGLGCRLGWGSPKSGGLGPVDRGTNIEVVSEGTLLTPRTVLRGNLEEALVMACGTSRGGEPSGQYFDVKLH